jgi:hypothetical protein
MWRWGCFAYACFAGVACGRMLEPSGVSGASERSRADHQNRPPSTHWRDETSDTYWTTTVILNV